MPLHERHATTSRRFARKLDGTRGRDYWRSLEAVAETPEFKEFLHREFPQNASEWLDPVGRRGFLKLMSASLALAGVSACTRQPNEVIVPYVRQPEEESPGKPLFFATAMPLPARASGCWSRATKAGRRRSKATPIIRRAAAPPTCSRRRRSSASTIPDRSQTLTHLGDIRPFSAFVAAMRRVRCRRSRRTKGAGLRILTETVASPTLAAQIDEFLGALPAGEVDSVGAGRAATTRARAAGSRSASTSTRSTPSRRPTSSSRSTPTSCHRRRRRCVTRARSRRAAGSKATSAQLNRLYAVESDADEYRHAAPITACRSRRREIEAFARAVAAQRRRAPASATRRCRAGRRCAGSIRSSRICRQARGRSLVIAGDGQPPVVHALAHAMNDALGNVGATVVYTQTAEAQPIESARGAAASSSAT